MKKLTLILVFLFLQFGFSQSMMKSTSISSNFSPIEIEVYQESADKKTADFYSYLNLLSNKKNSEKIKSEIRENILLLFRTDKTQVIDFFSEKGKKTTLSEFLDKIKNQEVHFAFIKKKLSEPELYENYWLSEYSVEITQNREKSVKKIIQKIYFSPKNKKFGSKSKEVWEIKLGEIE